MQIHLLVHDLVLVIVANAVLVMVIHLHAGQRIHSVRLDQYMTLELLKSVLF